MNVKFNLKNSLLIKKKALPLSFAFFNINKKNYMEKSYRDDRVTKKQMCDIGSKCVTSN